MNTELILNNLFNEYNLSDIDKSFFLGIIEPIYTHPEFQKRLNSNQYPHHAKTSLGEHILNDAITSFIIAKNGDFGPLDFKLIILIAMFHDLYELPWQNSPIIKHKFANHHGFTHPLEAAINAITWFPNYFLNEEEAAIIIDGIIHHMYPFPVRSIIDDFIDTELNNLDKINYIPSNLKNIIIASSCRTRVLNVSISRSKFLEGRIVSKADKLVSFKKEIKNFNSYKALITGKNNDLK